MDGLLASTNYTIEGVDAGTGDTEITLGPGEKRRITFLLKDPATGLDVVKTLTFDGDSYSADLELTIKRGGQIVPQAKVRIGPSIGDQGVKHYSFYSVAPEAVAAIGDKVERHQAQAINENKNSPDRLVIPGPVDWAASATLILRWWRCQANQRRDSRFKPRSMTTRERQTGEAISDYGLGSRSR